MFRPFFNKLTVFNSCVNNQISNISNRRYLGIQNFENIIGPFSKKFEPIKNLTPILKKITSKQQFINLGNELEEISNKIKSDDINHLKSVVSDNFYRINFNEYNYFKFPFLETDFLTAYLIIWNYNAETNIHTHPSNGCYILKLDGQWEETIYTSKHIEKRLINSLDVCFINNEIGSHKVKFLENKCSKVGFSLNIYSPTIEIE